MTFLEALRKGGGDIERAKDAAGYAVSTMTQDIVRPLKDEILDIAQEILASNAIKAAAGLVGLIDDPAQLAGKEKLAAITQLMDRVGISRTERVEVNLKKDNIFILPAKDIIEGEFENVKD